MTETLTDDAIEDQIAAEMGDDEPEGAQDAPEPVDATDEPEPEPEPAQAAVDDRVMEKRYAAAGKAATAYARKIGDIFEEQAVDLTPCPLCPDVHKGFVNIHDAGRVPEEISRAAMLFLGFAREQEYEPDPTTRECPECVGYGLVRTGSRVVNNETRQCQKCRGFGFVPPPDTGANGARSLDTSLAPVGEHGTPLNQDERDPWGDAKLLPDGRLNPNYGKMPQFKVPVAPWGVTAGLTAQDAPV